MKIFKIWLLLTGAEFQGVWYTVAKAFSRSLRKYHSQIWNLIFKFCCGWGRGYPYPRILKEVDHFWNLIFKFCCGRGRGNPYPDSWKIKIPNFKSGFWILWWVHLPQSWNKFIFPIFKSDFFISIFVGVGSTPTSILNLNIYGFWSTLNPNQVQISLARK